MPQVQRTERHIEKVQQYPGGPHGERVNEIITISEAPIQREKLDLGQRIVRLVVTAVGFGLAAAIAQDLFGGPHAVWLMVGWVLWWAVQE